MPLILIIIGSVLVGVGIWGVAIMAAGLWYYLDEYRKVRNYRRNDAEKTRLNAACDVWRYAMGLCASVMLTSWVFLMLVPAMWVLTILVVSGFGWVITSMIYLQQVRALRR